jgi:hypothetical protein
VIALDLLLQAGHAPLVAQACLPVLALERLFHSFQSPQTPIKPDGTSLGAIADRQKLAAIALNESC